MFVIKDPIRKIAFIAGAYAVISGVLFQLDNLAVLTPVRTLFKIVVMPEVALAGTFVQNVQNGGAITISSFAAARKLDTVQKQYSALLPVLAENQTLRKENETLRTELHIAEKDDPKRIVGHLLQSDDQYVLAVESADPIKPGTAVSQNGNLIGLVTARVSQQVYTVIKTTHPSFKAKAKVLHEGESPTEGIVIGQFGSSLRLTRILAKAPIAQNDIVIFDDATPGNKPLLLGKITKIIQNETDLFKEAIVSPLSSLTQDATVFVQQ